MTNPFERPQQNPITGVAMVDYQPDRPWVVLERVEPDVVPEYCTHGKVTCRFCDEWCWLGDQTFKLVRGGEANPICIECATEKFPPGSVPSRHIEDHRRADGPH